MALLYPPYIEGTVPAFYSGTTYPGNGANETSAILVVPFSMNRAVSIHEISGFSLKIKTVQNNTFIKTIASTLYSLDDLTVTFEMPSDLLTIGQSYKIQLAYIDTQGAVGHYSTVGVVKYTVKPTVTINGLTVGQVNNFVKGFVGIYNHAGDPSEKEYSYQFIIADADSNIIADSGVLLHNSNNDTSNIESSDSWEILNDLEIDKSYYIQYIVTTNNKMICKSARYRIMQRETIDPEVNVTINADLNKDNGYVTVTLIGGKNSNGVEEPAVGAFLLSRCDILNQKEWDEVFRFSLQGELPSRILWKDFTVEQGKTYIYALQQYNDFGLYSNRIESNEIYVDFEDAFLFDGEQQLKIRYNPKVSSFKNDILESKMDTIGSKYPFIFRNGNVNYKEFPVSGLISYWMDEEELFLPIEELGLDDVSKIARETTVRNGDRIDNTYYTYALDSENITADPSFTNSLKEKNLLSAYTTHRKEAVENIISKKTRTTTLEGYNVAAERIFKLKVLDWLTNGKPKLFRSPSEGNYIVRLIGTSLTPTDGVNRMLHTFSSTAYEIAECNYTNLANYNFLHLETPSNERLRWSTLYLPMDIALSGTDADGKQWQLMYDELLRDRSINNNVTYAEKEIANLNTGNIKYARYPISYSKPCRKASSIEFEGLLPGDKVYISYAINPDRAHYSTSSDYTTIIIGTTGSYKVNSKRAITSVIIPTGDVTAANDLCSIVNGSFTYSYSSAYQNTFDIVNDVNIYDVPARQFIGENHDKDNNGNEISLVNKNIITSLLDIKTSITKYYDLLFQKRPVHTIYFKRSDGMLQLNESSFKQNNRNPVFYVDKYCTQAWDADLEKEDNDWDSYTVYKIEALPLDNHDDDYTGGDFHRGEYYYVDRRNNEYYPWDQLKKITIDSPDGYNANQYYLLTGSKFYTKDTGYRNLKNNTAITYFESVWNPVTNQYEYKAITPSEWQTRIVSTKTDNITLQTEENSRNIYTQVLSQDNYDENKVYYSYPVYEMNGDISVSTLNKYDNSIQTSKLEPIEFSTSGYQHIYKTMGSDISAEADFHICQYRWSANRFYIQSGVSFALSTSYEVGTTYYIKDASDNYHAAYVGGPEDDVYRPGVYYESMGTYFKICNDAYFDANKIYYISNNEYYNRIIKNRISDKAVRFYYADKEIYKTHKYYLVPGITGYSNKEVYSPIGINESFISNLTYYTYDAYSGTYQVALGIGMTTFEANQNKMKAILDSGDKFIYQATTDTQYNASKKYYIKVVLSDTVTYYREVTNLSRDTWDPTVTYYEKHTLSEYQLYILLSEDNGYWTDRNYYKYYNNIYIDGKTQLFIPNYDTKFYYNLGIENTSAATDFSKYDYDSYRSIDLNEREYYELENLDNIHDIYLTPGVMLTMAYQQRVIDYNLETTDAVVKAKKEAYEAAIANYEIDYAPNKIPAIRAAYADFLSTLGTALEAYKEAHAIDNDN